MKWSQSFLYTLKESPSDAEIPSHKLMIRAGLIKKVAPGIYTYGFLALRSIRKVEKIIRDELGKENCVEILMPMVQPRELWDESNRFDEMGPNLAKFTNRNGQEFCLGATHEEVVTDYVRHDLKSYRDMPVIIYQIQTKFRDEMRPRFGLMRGREFIMKDAYSFDQTENDALISYDKMNLAYLRIFKRLGVDFRVVKADSGNIGGDKSEEFHVLADSGEDTLMVSTSGTFAANIEVCPAIDNKKIVWGGEEEESLEKFATPNLKSIQDLSQALSVPEVHLVKTMFFAVEEDEIKAQKNIRPIAVCLRGSDEVNPVKIKNFLGLANPPRLLTENEVRQLTGASPGSCGPVGLKCPIYFDQGLNSFKNIIVGANEDGFHYKNANVDRDFKVTSYVDLRLAREGDQSPCGNGTLRSCKGIEVGHIFYLGTKYSKKMKANYLDNNGKAKDIEMGCYGLGVTRTVQAAVEQCHDEDGIVWPLALTPFHVHLCNLDPQDLAVNTEANRIYDELNALGIEVFMDDRKERPGVKFKDADLLGFPVRLTIGGRGLKEDSLDLYLRKEKTKESIKPSDVVKRIESLLRAM